MTPKRDDDPNSVPAMIEEMADLVLDEHFLDDDDLADDERATWTRRDVRNIPHPDAAHRSGPIKRP